MTKRFNIEKFNQILKECNQILFAVSITSMQIDLSNGLKITDPVAVRKCKKRIMLGHPAWQANFDDLYNIVPDIRAAAEARCRSLTSSAGGILCQKKHKDTLIKNLNTGTPWNKGLAGNYPYSHKHTDETKSKISRANSKEKNGMFGTTMTLKQKQHLSDTLKNKILTGEFTPNSNNRNTHWESNYRGKKYRSSWECLYQHFDPEAEYETLRIPYWYKSKEHIYIVDFVNHNTKIVAEVKPIEMTTDEKTKAKLTQVECWCRDSGYKFILVDKQYLLSCGKPNSLEYFDLKTQHKILKLYEATK